MTFVSGHKINIGNKNALGKHWKVKDTSKMGKGPEGKGFTEEHKRKIGLANKGEKHYLWGKHISEETKEKMRESHKGSNEKLKLYWTKERRKERSERMRGSKSNFWRGGLVSINIKIRMSLEYKLWRKSCFERDNFTCQKYGTVGGDLVVHHINNFAEFPELQLALDNGITLSKEAHKEFHKKYGNRNNTREQLNEFLLDAQDNFMAYREFIDSLNKK